MFATRRREFVDGLMALLIRGTSLMVLLLVLGMLLQLVWATVPLFEPLSIAEEPALLTGSPPQDPTLSHPKVAPAWVGEHSSQTAWFEDGRRRLWVAPRRITHNEIQLVGEYFRLDAPTNQWRRQPWALPTLGRHVIHLGFDSSGHRMVVFDGTGHYALIQVNVSSKYPKVQWYPLPSAVASDDALGAGTTSPVATAQSSASLRVQALAGGRSWISLGQGYLRQLHLVNRRGEIRLESLRSIPLDTRWQFIEPSPSGSRLLVTTTAPSIQLWDLSAAEQIWQQPLEASPVAIGWIDQDRFYLRNTGQGYLTWRFDEGRQGFNFDRLFQPMRYEGYAEPVRLWQPSSSAANFEQKLNVVPLLIGTLKAAFVALIIATPLAIGSAIFVGFFTPLSIRNRIKPAVEMIAAFPSVVIGAVVALWLAPYLLDALVSIVTAIIISIGAIVSLAMLWRRYALGTYSGRWLPLMPFLLIPGILLSLAVGAAIGRGLEALLFDGSLMDWLYLERGVSVQHRNAIIVGVALGFTIIPVIFSVAEDAINAVPRSAAAGSLALGASHWQSFREIVLPVAAPGIVAAVMLGFGRALGETMILLLVAGNSPIDSWSLVEGLQTLSATLAIELPESHVNSAHYRVLFLAALLLFALTLLFNTAAQLLKRYMRRHFGVQL